MPEHTSGTAGLVAEELGHVRQQAGQLFSNGKFTEAAQLYSILAQLAPHDHTAFSNRAAALLRLGQPDAALRDAQTATKLAPGWTKGWYRQGMALSAMERHREAAAAFAHALKLEPANKDVQSCLKHAQKKADAHEHACSVQRELQAMHVAWALTTARQAKECADMERQLEQGMVGYPWQPKDWEWRPTWPPVDADKPTKLLTAAEPPKHPQQSSPENSSVADSQPQQLPSGEQQGQQQQGQQQQKEQQQQQPGAEQQHLRSFLASYTNALADLEAPRAAALGIAQDTNLLHFYASALEDALASHPGAHVLVVGRSGGVLAMLAAAAGAGRVTDVAKSPLLHRMAQVLLQGNREAAPEMCGRVQLAPCALEDCWLAGSGRGGTAAAEATGVAGAAGDVAAVGTLGRTWNMAEPAHVLVTDLFDHRMLGHDVLKAIETAVSHGLLAPDAVIVPAAISVHAALLEARTATAAGFNVSPLNEHRWYPGAAAVDLARDKGVRLLSASAQVVTIDLQQHITPDVGEDAKPVWSKHVQDQCTEPTAVQVHVAQDGRATGVGFWLQLHSPRGDISTFAPAGTGAGGSVLPPLAVASSVKQGLHYLDRHVHVTTGQQVSLMLQQQKRGCLRFWLPSPEDADSSLDGSASALGRLHHASLPSWHFDMVADVQRNSAYDAAIRRAVIKQRAHLPPGAPVRVLDIGAGSGLLSMMAARAGADEVTAVECVGHLAEVAEHVIALNGFSRAITVIHKDGRYLTAGTQPDGRPGDLAAPADLLVFEVFDSGLIGEGALHILTAARTKLLRPGAGIVPSAARVFCQPIQFKRLGQLHLPTGPNHDSGVPSSRASGSSAIDATQLNRFAWRPGYFGADLSRTAGSSNADWQALAPPKQVLALDFTSADPHAAFQPTEVEVCFEASATGVVNAVAFWFELQLDEETRLDTGPYSAAGPTWQQAIQYLPAERPVIKGDSVSLLASHDTYSITFRMNSSAAHPEQAAVAGAYAAGTAPRLPGPPSSIGNAYGPATPSAASARGAQGMQHPHTQQPHAAAAAALLVDPVWQARHQQLEALGQGLAGSMARDPLEFRKLSRAALELAARPHELRADAAQAAALCARMMM